MKGLRKLFTSGGVDRLSLRYWSPEVEASWAIDVEGPESLQIVYERKNLPDRLNAVIGVKEQRPDESFWIYLHPSDAAVIGAILVAYAAANGENT